MRGASLQDARHQVVTKMQRKAKLKIVLSPAHFKRAELGMRLRQRLSQIYNDHSSITERLGQ